MTRQPRVFISRTTAGLKGLAEQVADILRQRGIEPIIQTGFYPSTRDVKGMLAEHLQQCDAVICLIGSAYGSGPHDPITKAEQPVHGLKDPRTKDRLFSYTQLELLIARDLGRPIYTFFIEEQKPHSQSPLPLLLRPSAAKTERPTNSDSPQRGQGAGNAEAEVILTHPLLTAFAPEPPELAQRQQTFITEFAKDGRNTYGTFSQWDQPADATCGLKQAIEAIQFEITVLAGKRTNLPYTSLGTLFKGRDEFLAELRQHLTAEGPVVIKGKRTIHGMGGVGKTRAAIEYAWKDADDYHAPSSFPSAEQATSTLQLTSKNFTMTSMSSSEHQRPFHIFISRVTGEFGRLSEALAADLRSKGFIGKIQFDFRQEENTETTLDKLELLVRSADAVVAIVGQRSGSYPPEYAASKWAHVLPTGITKATYTQWEVHFARHYQKRLSLYFGFDHANAKAHFEPESPPDPKIDDLSAQKAYALWLTQTLGLDHDYFSSEHHLRLLVLKEPWPVEITSSPGGLIHPTTPTQDIPVRTQDSGITLNLLMRWSFFQRSAVVLLKSEYNSDVICSSVVRTLDEGRAAAQLANKDILERRWIKLSAKEFDWSAAGSFGITSTFSVQGQINFAEEARLKSGEVLLGLIVHDLPDLSPRTMQQLQAWLNAVRAGFPACAPLMILIHDMPEAAASRAAQTLSGIVECLSTAPDFRSDPMHIVSDREVSELGSNGIGALISLAWRDVHPRYPERTAMTKLMPWLIEAPKKLASPLRAGHVVEQLEAMNADQAKDLASALCEWLINYHPRLAAPVFQSLAGASMQELTICAAYAAMDHPLLLDAWIVGVPECSRTKVMIAVSAQYPAVSGCAATAWVRGVLRGQISDAETCVRWIRSRCPALAPVAEAVLPTVNSNALLALLKSNTATGNFHWLGQLAPCLEIPIDEVDAGARQRAEFWTLVQSLPVTARHLCRLFSLPAEELAILGCYNSSDANQAKAAIIETYATRLREESAY